MAVEFTHFVQPGVAGTREWDNVLLVGRRLHEYLTRPEVGQLLAQANRPGTSSAAVQAAFAPAAKALGFESERKGLFDASIPGLRPDYYRALGDSGILLEVERGKTTTNNMDLLDFWKCHLCARAHYLFLLVPQALQHNPDMTPKREYEAVCRRLGTFFQPGMTTNVRGLLVFGY